MIEFIDVKLVTAVIFLFIVVVVTHASFGLEANNGKATKESKSSSDIKWFLFIGTLIGVVLIDAKYSYISAKENIKNFRGAKVLCCTMQNGRDSNSKYKISLKDGWEVDKLYFIKDSLMIRADKCEEM